MKSHGLSTQSSHGSKNRSFEMQRQVSRHAPCYRVVSHVGREPFGRSWLPFRSYKDRAMDLFTSLTPEPFDDGHVLNHGRDKKQQKDCPGNEIDRVPARLCLLCLSCRKLGLSVSEPRYLTCARRKHPPLPRIGCSGLSTLPLPFRISHVVRFASILPFRGKRAIEMLHG